MLPVLGRAAGGWLHVGGRDVRTAEPVGSAPGRRLAPFALALALSARSNVLQEFDGRPGQIALHGLANIGGVLGTAASHGCIRLNADAMRWLVERIDAGVPVTVSN